MNDLSTSYEQRTCVHFQNCSGCDLLVDEIPNIWAEVLNFFKERGIEPRLRKASCRAWRLKARLAVRGTAGNPEIGLYKRGTHEVSSIPHCLVHHPAINRAVEIIKKSIIRHGLSPYNESTQLGCLKYLQLFVERKTRCVQLGLILNSHSLDPLVESFFNDLSQSDLWHSIWVNFHPDNTNRILGSTWKHIRGDEWLWQQIGAQQIAFHPGAFAQAHLELFEIMLQTIQSWVPPNSHILELFAGVGAIGRSLLPTCKSLTLVENNPFAQLSYLANPSPKCKYILQDANQFQGFSPFDTVIVDPPRKGLSDLLLKNLSAANLRLIYISCGWESFQRDCEELIASGWKLKAAEGFLFFPGTNHIETVALFEM